MLISLFSLLVLRLITNTKHMHLSCLHSAEAQDLQTPFGECSDKGITQQFERHQAVCMR